ncbi:Acetyl esterase/lipase [Granulicella pectinivorans]|uniref:Acetyl esterase/lipase n=2 Tax=Granulicella pectinivorans TaxID=474950 RepID=A0A1I6MXI7_9BACT|nr:Acetyl esterase/lipase [Granulicella pectinivorans]
MNRRDFTVCGLGASIHQAVSWRLYGRTLQTAASMQLAAQSVDPYSLVDPELLAAVKGQPQGILNDEIVANAQKQIPQISAVLPSVPGVKISRRSIPGPAGIPDVSIVIADTAPEQKNKPVLLHMHGGGYVVGAAVAFLPGVLLYAKPTGCVVVSVDYRLAPQTRFPGSLNDNYAALSWVYHHAEEMGADRKRIAIAGESAGGGHAAALAIHARDRAEVPIIFQLLIYPMLDDRTGSTRGVPPHIGQIGWSAAGNRYGWAALLGSPAGSEKLPYGAVPARVEDLRGLPPAFIGVGAIDLFVDEDVDYARRLIDAAVPTELLVVPGAYHAFDLSVPDAQVSRSFRTSITAALRRAFKV